LRNKFPEARRSEKKKINFLATKFKFLNIPELNLNFIKNEVDYTLVMLSLMILKAFAQKKFKIKTEEVLYEKNESLKYNSYRILNNVRNQFDYFIK
jgi:hypothetical protein